jgi:hypothetical protein
VRTAGRAKYLQDREQDDERDDSHGELLILCGTLSAYALPDQFRLGNKATQTLAGSPGDTWDKQVYKAQKILRND